MVRRAQNYATGYKKKVDVEADTYLPRSSPKGILSCHQCGAVYYHRRWTLTPTGDLQSRMSARGGFRSVLCPACRKIGDRYPSGELRLLGVTTEENKAVLGLLKNEEERARQKNPLERIMTIETDGKDWTVATTTEKLAQRLGRSLEKAIGGKATYQWSHNNKFVRVFWIREPSPKVH
jgi:hypothetical protein